MPGPLPPGDPDVFAGSVISLAVQDMGSGNAPRVTWTTTAEPGVAGFDVYRAEFVGGDYVLGDRLTSLPIVSMGGTMTGASYQFDDPATFTHGAGDRHYYVAIVSTSASADLFGPVTLIDPTAPSDTWLIY